MLAIHNRNQGKFSDMKMFMIFTNDYYVSNSQQIEEIGGELQRCLWYSPMIIMLAIHNVVTGCPSVECDVYDIHQWLLIQWFQRARMMLSCLLDEAINESLCKYTILFLNHWRENGEIFFCFLHFLRVFYIVRNWKKRWERISYKSCLIVLDYPHVFTGEPIFSFSFFNSSR